MCGLVNPPLASFRKECNAFHLSIFEIVLDMPAHSYPMPVFLMEFFVEIENLCQVVVVLVQALPLIRTSKQHFKVNAL